MGVKPKIRLLINPLIINPLFELCETDTGNNDALIDIILQDAPLCAEIFQASAPFRSNVAISRSLIDEACSRLGRDTIRSFVAESATRLLDADFDDSQQIYLKDMLYFSGATADVAREIALKSGYGHPEEAYFAGLMHNIGKISLFSRSPEKYVTSDIPVISNQDALKIESEVFGTNHIIVAKALISRWRLDSFCVDAIHFLHQGGEQIIYAPMLIKILQIAHKIISLSAGLKGEDFLWAKNNIGIDPEALEAIASSAGNQYDQITTEQYLSLLAETKEAIAKKIFQTACLSAAQLSILRAAISPHFVDELREALKRTFPVRETVFFRFDGAGHLLYGMAAAAQTPLFNALQTSLADKRSVVARALAENRILYFFKKDKPAAVVDYQLMRLCQAEGICCVPLKSGNDRLGTFVLALESEREGALNEKFLEILAANIAEAIKNGLKRVAEKEMEKEPGDRNDRLRKLAHQMRTPFSTITNYLHVIDHKGRQQGIDLPEIDKIITELDGMEQLVDYYTREMPEKTSKTLDINTLLEKTLSALNTPVIESRQITVHVEADNDRLPIVADPTSVQQILTNLIVNAAEALETTEGDRNIVISTRDRVNLSGKTFVEISIKDNGPGIDPDILQNLFQPVDSTKGEGHDGLGLNIVRNLAEEINGEIFCHSLPGEGTTFSLLIPRNTI